MSQRPRVLLLIPHLGGGGAERVTELLTRHLSSDKYELHLCLVTQDEVSDSPFPPWITLHAINARRVRHGTFRILSLVRHLRPQVVLSNMVHLNFLVLLLKPLFPRETHVLVRQNGTFSSMLRLAKSTVITSFLYRLLYRRADGVLCQSSHMADDLHQFAGIPLRLLAVLPNPVDIDTILSTKTASPSRWLGPGPHLLAVGRLSHEKGFDILLDAFVLLKSRFPGADMTIVGQGPEEAAVKARCRRLGLDSAVHFTGYVASPAAFFKGTTLFVISSRHEGMPNALLEAAAAGLPIVATSASGGLFDLLNQQPGVWLAREVSAKSLAESLTCACVALHANDRFSHKWIDSFRLDHAIPAYERTIDAALAKGYR
jgi:glycosyltransferase involved in cell wall biosynthesis